MTETVDELELALRSIANSEEKRSALGEGVQEERFSEETESMEGKEILDAKE